MRILPRWQIGSPVFGIYGALWQYLVKELARFGGDAALLTDIFESLTTWVENLIHTFGLPGVTLIALLENLFPPTPSEFLYPLAGKLVADGSLTALGVIAAGIVGSLAGSLTYYAIGYWLGEARARKAIGRFGHIQVWRFQLMIVSLDDYDLSLIHI